MEAIKEIIQNVKTNWKLHVVTLVVGYVAGGLTIGPIAALIQYIKDAIK